MTDGRNRKRRRRSRGRPHVLHVRLSDAEKEWVDLICVLGNSSKSGVFRMFFAHKDSIQQIVEKNT